MKDAKTYREYAADCTRMSKLMGIKNKEILLKMAAAWEERAKQAERQAIRNKGEQSISACFDRQGCGTRLKPLAGDCCVFCSYGSVPCPPIQESGKGACCS